MKVRDSQRSRVYNWERSFSKLEYVVVYKGRADSQRALRQIHQTWGQTLEMPEARAFVAEVWKNHAAFDLRNNPPFLQDGRGVSNAHGSSTNINIPRSMRNRWILCHEIAHGLVGAPKGWTLERSAAHGKEFVRTLIELLVRYDGRDRGELERTAAERKLKVAQGTGGIYARHKIRFQKVD